MIRFLLPVLLLFTFSCSRQNQSASRIAPVFDAQVRNAVNMGDGDLEVQALRKRLLDNPSDTTVRRRLAAKFEASGYPDLALEHLRIAFELAPTDLSLGLDLATALNDQRLSTQANQVLAATLKTAKPTAAQWSRAAILTDSISSLPEGEVLHRKALSLDTSNFNFSNNLAYNLIRQNRASEAEQLLRDILRAKPTHELARNNLAKLYATHLNQPEEALLHWKAISGPAAAHNNLAAAYIELGKWTEAKIELEKALALRFQFPEALQNLQIVAARTGGTVELNLDRDKKQSSLSKLTKALRHVFVSEDDGTQKSNHHRSRS
jgi:Flp pilus assembly protein TadD